jgi:DNA helicase TIP49 (TBP-interacting protein)
VDVAVDDVFFEVKSLDLIRDVRGKNARVVDRRFEQGPAEFLEKSLGIDKVFLLSNIFCFLKKFINFPKF